MPSYVVVDAEQRTIIGGPYLQDWVADWTPPEPGAVMLEADAVAEGFTVPSDPAAA